MTLIINHFEYTIKFRVSYVSNNIWSPKTSQNNRTMIMANLHFQTQDSVTDSDSDSKSHSYIVLYRTCSHCTDSDSDPQSILYPFLGLISVPKLRSVSISVNVNKP